jgi:hypothetical protein
MKYAFITLIVVVIVSVFAFIQAGPSHASCKLEWNWPATNCKVVADKLLSQIDLWKTRDNCAQGGEKCLYKLVSQSDTEIKATHTTPKKDYVDDLTFTLVPSGNSCKVKVKI